MTCCCAPGVRCGGCEEHGPRGFTGGYLCRAHLREVEEALDEDGMLNDDDREYIAGERGYGDDRTGC